jgi:RNA recognition motif-containing protein
MNIYVGNLSYEVTEEDLKKAFELCPLNLKHSLQSKA